MSGFAEAIVFEVYGRGLCDALMSAVREFAVRERNEEWKRQRTRSGHASPTYTFGREQRMKKVRLYGRQVKRAWAGGKRSRVVRLPILRQQTAAKPDWINE